MNESDVPYILKEKVLAKKIYLIDSDFSYTFNPIPPDNSICSIVNIGNSCYLNSILQCLFHCPDLCDLFENHIKFNMYSNTPRVTHTIDQHKRRQFIIMLGNMFNIYWHNSCSENTLYNSIYKKLIDNLTNYINSQLDLKKLETYNANEILLKIIDYLSDGYIYEHPHNHHSLDERRKYLWILYNPIIKIFSFLESVCKTCSNCNHKTVIYNRSNILQLTITNESSKLDKLIDEYYNDINIPDKCTNCDQPNTLTQSRDMYSIYKTHGPSILIIFLIRNNETQNNIEMPLTYNPLIYYNLSNDTLGDSYKLFAYSYHIKNNYGTVCNNTLTTNTLTTKWYIYNNNEKPYEDTLLPYKDLGYVYFYKRVT